MILWPTRDNAGDDSSNRPLSRVDYLDGHVTDFGWPESCLLHNRHLSGWVCPPLSDFSLPSFPFWMLTEQLMMTRLWNMWQSRQYGSLAWNLHGTGFCFQGGWNITSPSLPSYGVVSLSTPLISLIQVIQFHVSYIPQTPFPSDPWCLLHPTSFQPHSLKMHQPHPIQP